MAEKQVRLDKLLSESAGLTRKEAKAVLNKGRVSVNGRVLRDGSQKVSGEDEIFLDAVRLEAGEKFLYLMLYKPAGVVSATGDGKDRTVLDLVREQEGKESGGLREYRLGKRELFPVGRLDKDTEGLLLITDDGELAHHLLSPKRHVDKVYFARLSGLVPEDAAERFAEGILVGQDYRALPAGLAVLGVNETERISEVEITLREGKFHQVKRMCHELGCEVTYLKRLSMGSLVLDETLQPGECRRLSEAEIKALKME